MPTYLQLANEPVWGAQYVPANLTDVLIKPLRAHFGLGPGAVAAAGDNNHLDGRHRSYNWDKQSVYCTNRSYGTTDGRDQSGDRNWYRACDVGITGQTLYDASHAMDALVRSGGAPGVAEWFGTYDGKTVVGWYQGHASSSDSSHLTHLHVGFWNQYANDAATMQKVYAAITGTGDDMTPEEHAWSYTTLSIIAAMANGSDIAASMNVNGSTTPVSLTPYWARVAASLTPAQLAAIGAAAQAGAEAGAPTHDELVAAAQEGAELAEDA